MARKSRSARVHSAFPNRFKNCCYAGRRSGCSGDGACRRVPRHTLHAIAGLSSEGGGIMRFTTLRNSVANVLSRVAAT